MPARDPLVRRIAADLGNTARHNGPDDPRLPDLRRDLRAAKLEERVRRDVDTWPPFTPEQREKLAALMRGTSQQEADGADGGKQLEEARATR